MTTSRLKTFRSLIPNGWHEGQICDGSEMWITPPNRGAGEKYADWRLKWRTQVLELGEKLKVEGFEVVWTRETEVRIKNL